MPSRHVVVADYYCSTLEEERVYRGHPERASINRALLPLSSGGATRTRLPVPQDT